MQRDLLDVESVAGHLLPAGSVFALLAEHRHQLFPAEMFTDLFPSGRGRPSIPPEVVASVLVLQTVPGLSDREAADAVVKPTPVPTHRSDRPRQVTVHVAGKGADAQEQPHELMVVGGGPMNDTSRDYVKALRKLLDWIENDTEWQRWWAHAPVAVLEVYYWFDNGKPGVRVRRAASKVTASITRSAAEQGRGAEGRDQARQDVLALIGRLRTRLDLPEPPPLPSPGARSRPVNLAHDPGHLPRL